MSKSVWSVYKNSSDTFRQACVTEWRSWLEEVKPETARRKLESRLQSDKNNDHFSARMELYFHHYFKSRGCEIEIEPNLLGRDDHPDFLIHHDLGPFILEARISEAERGFLYQEQFADSLRQALRNVQTAHTVDIDLDNPMELPPLDFSSEVASFVAEQLGNFDNAIDEEATAEWVKPIMGKSYRLQFRLRRGAGARSPLSEGWNLFIITGGWIGVSKLYDNIKGKAVNYGSLDKPYVIAIWDLNTLSMQSQGIEREALYGPLELVIERDHKGHPIGTHPRIKPNGVFENVRHDKVSACVFYTHRLLDICSEHFLHVYHNPYAIAPLPSAIFEGSPQLIPVKTNTGFDISKWTVQPKY